MEDTELPGVQAPTTFAYLLLERAVHVPIERLAEVLWSTGAPPTWRPALRTLIAQVRRVLSLADPAASIVSGPAGYRVHLTGPVHLDIDGARLAARRSEEALARGELDDAVMHAAEAERTVRNPFLPRAEGSWVDSIRDELHGVRIRALHVLGESHLQRGDPIRAARAANEAIELDPVREASHRLAMRALADGGEKGQAAEAFERCRFTLAEELGVDPSPQTRDLLTAILRG